MFKGGEGMSYQSKDNNVSENIKETAGAAFHAVHSALEATENVAMNAVDATTNAVKNVTGNNRSNRK